MNMRPSRLVVVLGRWALMTGMAGIVLAGLALLDRWRMPANIASRRNLLVISAVLLASSFVLAPLVRRAFGLPSRPQVRRVRSKTLLDEMREQALDEEGEGGARDAHLSQPPPTAFAPIVFFTYLAFGVTLVAVLIALH